MIKFIAVILTLLICLSSVACGGDNTVESGNNVTVAPTTSESNEDNNTPEETEADTTEATVQNTVYAFGETITTEYFSFTPIFGGFADKLANWPDSGYLTPSGQYAGTTPYSAGNEKSMLYFSAIVNYSGKSKKNETFSCSFEVDYDNGYVFDNGTTAYSYDESDWGDYIDYLLFEPLSSRTIGYTRFCIQIPKAIEENPTAPLLVIFTINGEKYIYSITEDTRQTAISDAEKVIDDKITKYGLTKATPETVTTVTKLLQGTWELDLGFGMTETITFDGSNISDLTSLMGVEVTRKGTYDVYNGALLIIFDTGAMATLEYTLNGSELELPSAPKDIT